MLKSLLATRHIRKIRGGAQAHLLAALDGNFYVVKFRNNPQHRRILINELVSSCLLRHLEINTPAVVLIEVTKKLIDDSPALTLELASGTVPVEAGWQFGSKCPVDPNTVAIWDFIPDTLLKTMVNNIAQFLGVLAFDKWVSNADSRQAIFCKTPRGAQRSSKCETFMIDNGLAFNGGHWNHLNSPVQGLYTRKIVYETVVSLDDFQPWLDRIIHFPEAIIGDALRQIPAEWLEGDACELQALCKILVQRQMHVEGLIVDCTRANPNSFPRWLG